jgi:hypothetical protein
LVRLLLHACWCQRHTPLLTQPWWL